MDKELLEILACPVCKGHLELKNESLFCSLCQKEYIFKEGIPILLQDKETI